MQQYSQFPLGTTQWPVRFCRHAPNIRATKMSSVVYRPLTRSLWAENAKLLKVQNWSAEETAGKMDFDRSCVLYSKSYNHCRFQVNTPPSSSCDFFFFFVFENHEKHWSRKIPKVFLQNLKPPIKKKKKEKRERKSLQQDDNLKKHARIKNHTPDKLAFVIYI